MGLSFWLPGLFGSLAATPQQPDWSLGMIYIHNFGRRQRCHGTRDHARAVHTYFDPKTGNEFSAVAGFTYNFINPPTDYQNGIDLHLDWGVSKFVTKHWQIGLVGYFFNQISCDSGAGDRVGCFESRVAGVGPRIGYVFPINGHYQGSVNLRVYGEFAAEHRADGCNTWLTFAVSPAAPSEPPTTAPMIHK